MGVRHTETNLIIWSGSSAAEAVATPNASHISPGERLAALFNADKFFDAGDKGCAFGPMDEIAALMLRMEPGQTLEIHATDKTVAIDLAAWCRMTGHNLVEQRGSHYLIQHKVSSQ